MPISARAKHADDTNTLVGVVKYLEKHDFTTRMGSGVVVRLLDLEDKPICDEFCIRGEDLEPVKPLLINSIKEALKLRIALRQAEIREIESIQTPT